MSDPDRINTLEERLRRSEQLMDEVQEKLETLHRDPGSDGQVAKLKKDLEDQRQEFEALIGRLNEELEAVQFERDDLTRRLENAASFDDEPTDNYSPDKLHGKKEG